MTVYVDKLFPTIPQLSWPFSWACHLVADTTIELHAFARQLGLQSEWYQVSQGRIPHYDLTLNKRKQALRLGAKEISGRELIQMFRAVQK
jgi:hypothetical protein